MDSTCFSGNRMREGNFPGLQFNIVQSHRDKAEIAKCISGRERGTDAYEYAAPRARDAEHPDGIQA